MTSVPLQKISPVTSGATSIPGGLYFPEHRSFPNQESDHLQESTFAGTLRQLSKGSMEMPNKLTMPTLEQLNELPTDALWLEVAQLAEHGISPVAHDAGALLRDRSVTPTPQVVFSLWCRQEELTAKAGGTLI